MQTVQSQTNLVNYVDYMLLEETSGYFTQDGSVSLQPEILPEDLNIETYKDPDCVIL